MSWQIDLIEAVRVYINDLDSSNYLYNDDRLERIVIIAAAQVIQEVQFLTSYTVDIQNSSISPDPASEPKDTSFLILVALKTACMILGGETKQYATSGGGGITITDAGSTISTGNMFKNIQDVAKDVCGQYQLAKLNYKMGESFDGGVAITTPCTTPNSVYTTGYYNRSNYGNIY